MTLPESIQDFALAAIAAQRRLNEATNPLPGLMPHYRISEWTVASSCLIATESGASFGLAVQPANLSFQITHRLRRETLSRFAVTIEQCAAFDASPNDPSATKEPH